VSLSAWLFAVSIFASALGGALGMASGIFIVPVLTLFAGLGFRTAVAASIVSVIACSSASAAPFLRNGVTNMRLALVLEVATTLGALTGVLLTGSLPVRFLYLLFAAVLAVSAWQMIARRNTAARADERADPRDWSTRLQLHSGYPDPGSGHRRSYVVRRLPAGLTLMYGAGVLSALLGIGSGVLKIPAMDTVLQLPLKVSSATSNFMIGVTAAASGVAYFFLGDIDPKIAGPVALGSVLGALLGARLLIAISARWLRILFVVTLIALGMQMLLAAAGVGPTRHLV
jgi:uncharacterized membrane protein YfcA